MYCHKCKKDTETKIIKEKEVYNVLNIDKIEVDANICICSICETKLFDEKLDSETINKVYEIFKEKHGYDPRTKRV